MSKLLVPVALLVAVVGILILTDEPQRPADFRFINRGDVATLDLQRMSWLQDLRVARGLFEGLVRNDVFSPEFTIIPGVAEKWSLSEDGLTYTFDLRADAKWSNGEPVTAHDFVYSWRRGMLPDSISDYAAQFQLIAGAEAFFNWRTRMLRGFTARDDVRKLHEGVYKPDESPEKAAQRIADLIWVFHEGMPDAVSSTAPTPLGSVRESLDNVLLRYGHQRAALETSRPEDREAAQETADASLRQMRESLGNAPATQLAALRQEVLSSTLDGHAAWERTEGVFRSLVKLEAVNDRQLRVELARPTPYFLDLCAFAVFYPVYPPLVKKYELPNAKTARLDMQLGWTKPPTLVSNGPFKLTVWRFKRDMRLEKNPYYWNREAINIDSIVMPSVEDPNAQILTFDSGGVDWVSDVSPPYRADMLAEKMKFYQEHKSKYDALVAQGLDPVEIDRKLPPDPRKRIHVFPTFGTYFYNFNCMPRLADGRPNPFADARVRRAFAMAVDREHIANQVRRIGERPASILIPPDSIAGYRSPKGAAYDPAAARRLLAEAGYPDGKGFITVEILYNKDSGHDVIAQAVARDWQENLGVAVALAQKEIKVFRDDLKTHNFMVSRAGWYGDYGDPTTFLDINRTADGNNDRAYSSARFDALMENAANERDKAKRLEILTEAERIIVEEDLPLIPIFHYVQMYLFDAEKVSGISSHPRQEQHIYLIDMLGDGKGKDEPRALPPAPKTGAPKSENPATALPAERGTFPEEHR